jgi:hypothetical protein
MTPNSSQTPKECSKFQEQLPEFFDSGADVLEHSHLKTCETCSSLVQDLEYIAAQAKLLLPIHDPSPAVWENIHNALSREPHNGEENS